jgi:hypothetical protein
MNRIAVFLLLCTVAVGSGCIQISPVGTPHPPSWIGAPAAILAPNSLEGESWRERNVVLPGREFIRNPPPGCTLTPPPEPLLAPQPYYWDPSHPLTRGP